MTPVLTQPSAPCQAVESRAHASTARNTEHVSVPRLPGSSGSLQRRNCGGPAGRYRARSARMWCAAVGLFAAPKRIVTWVAGSGSRNGFKARHRCVYLFTTTPNLYSGKRGGRSFLRQPVLFTAVLRPLGLDVSFCGSGFGKIAICNSLLEW